MAARCDCDSDIIAELARDLLDFAGSHLTLTRLCPLAVCEAFFMAGIAQMVRGGENVPSIELRANARESLECLLRLGFSDHADDILEAMEEAEDAVKQ